MDNKSAGKTNQSWLPAANGSAMSKTPAQLIIDGNAERFIDPQTIMIFGAAVQNFTKASEKK